MNTVTKVGCPILADYSDCNPISRPKQESITNNDKDDINDEDEQRRLRRKKKNKKADRKILLRPNHLDYSVSEYTMDRRPLITPFVSVSPDSTTMDNGDDDDGDVVERHQYLLIPQRDRIRVLSMKHGELVTELVPQHRRYGNEDDLGKDDDDEYDDDDDDDDDDKDGLIVINTVAIVRIGRCDGSPSILDDGTMDMEWANTTLLLDRNDTETATTTTPNEEETEESEKINPVKTKKEEWVVVAGLNNGTIQEWPLSSIVVSSRNNYSFILPSRIFELPKQLGGGVGVGDGSAGDVMTSSSFYNRSVTHLASCKRGILYALVSQLEQTTKTMIHHAGEPNDKNIKKRRRGKMKEEKKKKETSVAISTLVQIGLPNLSYRCSEGDCDVVVLSSNVQRLKIYRDDDGDGKGGGNNNIINNINNKNSINNINNNEPDDANSKSDDEDDDDNASNGDGDAAADEDDGNMKKYYSSNRISKQQRSSFLPIILLCSTVPNNDDAGDAAQDNESIAITVVNRHGFHIHYQSPPASNSSFSFVESFPSLSHANDITTAAISPNRRDLALGYRDGSIQLHISLYQPPPDDNGIHNPATAVATRPKALVRRIHWHSLPVKTLSWLGGGSQSGTTAAPLLLSGGEEAVIVLWNMEMGNNEPVDLLPRVTKGCITHIATNSFSNYDGDVVGGGGGSIGDVIVRCSDSTLHLLQGHNLTLRWKIQGLATPSNECVPLLPHPNTIHRYDHGSSDCSMTGVVRRLSPTAILCIDPRTDLPIFTRLCGAPGTIHWFQPSSSSFRSISSSQGGGGDGRVVGSLEIVPYNRISRRNIGMGACPRPTVSSMVMGKDGMDMVTVDVVVAEDGCAVDGDGGSGEAGSLAAGGGGQDGEIGVSVITTIKFWRWVGNASSGGNERKKKGPNYNDGSNMPYDLVSAMTYPHGRVNGTIDAIAITNDGSTVCSLANREGSFHIWRRNNTTTNTSINTVVPTSRRKNRPQQQQSSSSLSTSMVPRPVWKRDCRISIPAGYSNAFGNNDDPNDDDGYSCGGTPLAFSPDGSILTIAFGRHITVWDYNTSTLLNTVLTSTVERVRDLRFLAYPKDMLLAVGNRSVSLVSPCSTSSGDGGSGGYTGGSTWCYRLPFQPVVDGYRLGLGIVTPLSNSATIAVAIRMMMQKTTVAGDDDDDDVVVKTRIVLIDAVSGRPKMRTDDPTVPCYWTVRGNVDCMCDITTVDTDGWKLGNAITTTTLPNGNSGGKSKAILLVLIHTHDLLVLSTDDDGTNNTTDNTSSSSLHISRSKRTYDEPPPLTSIDDAPVLPLGKNKNKNKKNKKNVPPEPVNDTVGIGRDTFAPFLFFESTTSGGGSGGKSGSGKTAAAVPTQRLPPLTSAFTSAFLSNQFRKKEFKS